MCVWTVYMDMGENKDLFRYTRSEGLRTRELRQFFGVTRSTEDPRPVCGVYGAM